MIDIKELFDAGVHFGHRTSRWSPKMRPFIWGAKNKIHLIDISKTAYLLNRANEYLKQVTSNGGSVLWVGTKKAARDIIRSTAGKLEMPFVIHRWIGGTLSNFGQIKKAMTRYLHLKDVVSKSTKGYSKKEMSSIQKEIARLERNIGGILKLSYPPAALVVVDAKREHAALREAIGLGIPVIALVDTNTDPKGINFVIPANDDAPRSISCIVDHLVNSCEQGAAIYKEKKAAKEAEKKASAKAKADEKAPAKKETKAVSEDTKKETTKKTAAPKKAEVKETKAAPKKVATTKKAATTEPAEETKAAPKKAAPKKTAASDAQKAATTKAKSAAKSVTKKTTTAAKKSATKKSTTTTKKKTTSMRTTTATKKKA